MSKRRPRWQPPYPAATDQRRKCVWGKCQNRPYSAEIPICGMHVTVAHGIRQRDLAGAPTPLTITVDASTPKDTTTPDPRPRTRAASGRRLRSQEGDAHRRATPRQLRRRSARQPAAAVRPRLTHIPPPDHVAQLSH